MTTGPVLGDFVSYDNCCVAILLIKMSLLGRTGRSYFVARIGFENDHELALRDQFYRACSKFGYREQMALSRALGVDARTVRAWKYKESFPRWNVALYVIDWVERGKPMEKVSQAEPRML